MNRGARADAMALPGDVPERHNAIEPSPADSMTRCPRLAAFALTLLVAGAVHAEQKFFGLTSKQVSDVGTCSGEATLGIAAYMIYSSKKSYEEALSLALKSNETSVPKLPPADIERRLKAVYAAKPINSASWGRKNFEQCVVAKRIPVITERVGTCYTSSFYLSLIVDLRKQGGDSKEKIGVDLTTGMAEGQEKQGMLALVGYYFDRPATEASAQTLLDIRHFLTCASADQRPVSGTP